jgi:hypothetical protein
VLERNLVLSKGREQRPELKAYRSTARDCSPERRIELLEAEPAPLASTTDTGLHSVQK